MSESLVYCLNFPFSCPFIIAGVIVVYLPYVIGAIALMVTVFLWARVVAKRADNNVDPSDKDYEFRNTGMKCQVCGKRFGYDAERERPWLCRECGSGTRQ